MKIDELLLECADALQMPWDDGNRDEHIQQIEVSLATGELRETEISLLQETARIFKDQQGDDPVRLAMEGNKAGFSVAEDILRYLGEDKTPRFIYHGTVYGRLENILMFGLRPGEMPVWKNDKAARLVSDGAVCFTLIWRGAIQWAQVAHSTTRGRKDSLKRTPVIIRLSTDGLSLQQDPAASAPGCVMIAGTVPTHGANVLIGNVNGIPKWESIEEAISN